MLCFESVPSRTTYFCHEGTFLVPRCISPLLTCPFQPALPLLLPAFLGWNAEFPFLEIPCHGVVTGTGSTVETFSLREERSGGRRACFGRQPADSEIRLREAAAGRAQGRGVESPGSDTLRCYFLGAETRPSGGLKGCRLCSFRSGLGRGPSSSNRDDHAGKSGPQVGEPERQ